MIIMNQSIRASYSIWPLASLEVET